MQKQFSAVLYTLLLIAIFLPRLHSLDAFTSPDEAQWERNTQNFVSALQSWDVKQFYQQPHPGITAQWLAASSIDAPTWGEKRLPLAIFLSIAVLYITYLVRKLWGDGAALLAGFSLALNPLLIAHSRILAMDALLSVFMVAAVLHHLVWLEHRKKIDIALTGIFAALAILSKMSGAGLIAYFVIANGIGIVCKKISFKELRAGAFVFTIAIIITAIIVLPTLVTDFQYVLEGSKKFFSTEHFQQQVHALGPWWYPQAFLLWTTPLQLIGIALLPITIYKKNKYLPHLVLLTIFCILFFLEIQYSIKKGDRYMLPVFVAFDVITAASFATIYRATKNTRIKLIFCVLAIIGVGWQGYETIRLHPYLLAYRNPFFASVAAHRTMGWGEGLDLAAEYLNKKPDADNMLVAAYYEGSFGYHFKGEFTSAERLAKETAREIGANYVVLYRTMEGRAPERWETKVLQQYAAKTPEHVIRLNNEEYAWIYNVH